MGSDKIVRDARKMVTATDITEDAARLVRQASYPLSPDEHIQERINRAAHRLGLSFPQAKRLWYRERNEISAHEYLNLKIRAERIEEEAAAAEGLVNETRAFLARQSGAGYR